MRREFDDPHPRHAGTVRASTRTDWPDTHWTREGCRMTTNRRLDVYLQQTGKREHRQSSGWVDPGQCGAACSCGTYFDGFETLAAADALLDRHIARGNLLALTPKQRRRWEKKAARDAKRAVLAGAA